MSDMRVKLDDLNEAGQGEEEYDQTLLVSIALFHLIKEAGGEVFIPPSAFEKLETLSLIVTGDTTKEGVKLTLEDPDVVVAYLESLRHRKH